MKALKEFIEAKKGKTTFLEHEVKLLLKEAGLPVPKGIFIPKDMAERLPAALDLSYPLVAKISSAEIVSKSDVQGVRSGLRNPDELKKALAEILQIESAEGALIEEMALPGLEVIIGGIIDEQFGPVVMLGLGGIFVELFKDVVFGLAPMKMDDAQRLIKQIKGYKLLEGYRGSPPLDINTLSSIIITVSELTASSLIKEIDLNPVALYPEGAMILDAKMTILQTEP